MSTYVMHEPEEFEPIAGTYPPLPPDNMFAVKDSGARQEFSSGMVRDVEEGKTDWTPLIELIEEGVDLSLIFDGPMVARYARHLSKGAKKYSARNWMKARGDAEYRRFRRSAVRHFFQWLAGDRDEDHAAAVIFNMDGTEYVAARMKETAREA